jgi:hypothetical protein
MCFIIHKDHQRVIKAKKDTPCIKKFLADFELNANSKVIKAPYHSLDYELGECYYESNFDKKGGETGTIHDGIHSYHNSYINRIKKMGLTFSLRNIAIVLKCIIPEGAYYYTNPSRQEFVSDYLIVGTLEDILYIGGYMDAQKIKSIFVK